MLNSIILIYRHDEFWFALICIDMNVISALSNAIQQFRDGFDSK